MKLRHTPPVDRHEESIVAEIERAEQALRKAHAICKDRGHQKTDDGQSLRLRYKDILKSLEVALDNVRGMRGFGPMPSQIPVKDANVK